MKSINPISQALCSLGLSFALIGCGSGVAAVVTPPIVTPPIVTPPIVTPPVTETSQCKPAVTRPAGPATTSNYAGVSLKVTVKSGALPVIGSAVQLYSAGTTVNGLAPTALLSTAMTTDANGAVTLPANFTCPYNLSTLYVVARGGQAGTVGVGNSGIVLMAALGTCVSLTSGASFVVNEATTVASTYALGQFMTVGGNIGATSTNLQGLALAAAGAANLVNTTTGVAPGSSFPSTGTAPTALINTLANLLNTCTASGAASSKGCQSLYSATTINGTVPSNTLDAMLALATHPAISVATLYGLAQNSTAFAPAAAAAPSDFSLFVTYAGGGLNGPAGIGIDSVGNVRVANYFFSASFFSNTGAPTFANGITGNNLYNSYGLAVDYKDSSWITNQQSSSSINRAQGSITVLDSTGTKATTYSSGGLSFPSAVAIDSGGTTWIVDYGNSHLTLTDNTGTPLSGSTGYTSSQLAFPIAIAVDSKCYGFVANQSSTTVTRLTPDGASFTSYTLGNGPSGLAVDSADNVWVANYYGDSVGLLSAANTVVSTGYTGGGIYHPQGLAVDGSGNVWVANYRPQTGRSYSVLSELASATATVPGQVLSPATGYGYDANMVESFGIAIDAAGNVWVTNFGTNTMTEFMGIAAPVRTPLLGGVTKP